MGKPLLLRRLSEVRASAEAAHLEVVIHTALVTEAEHQGRLTDEVQTELNRWKMAEQKLLSQMSWLLDQLDETDPRK